MLTNTLTMIDKPTLERFRAWVKVLNIPEKDCLHRAFSMLDGAIPEEEMQVVEELSKSKAKKKHYKLKAEKVKWGVFRVAILEPKGYNKSSGLETAMALFIKHYDNVLREAL